MHIACTSLAYGSFVVTCMSFLFDPSPNRIVVTVFITLFFALMSIAERPSK